MWRKNNSNGLNDEMDKSFFYSVSMLSSNTKHAGRGHANLKHDVAYYYNVLYNKMRLQSDRTGLQADSITKDRVLVSMISEQILMYHYPSIIELEGGLRIC